MKDFRKTENGLFICEECGKTFVRACGLSLQATISNGFNYIMIVNKNYVKEI